MLKCPVCRRAQPGACSRTGSPDCYEYGLNQAKRLLNRANLLLCQVQGFPLPTPLVNPIVKVTGDIHDFLRLGE